MSTCRGVHHWSFTLNRHSLFTKVVWLLGLHVSFLAATEGFGVGCWGLWTQRCRTAATLFVFASFALTFVVLRAFVVQVPSYRLTM